MSVHVPPPWPSEGDAFDEVDVIEAKADLTATDLARLDMLARHPSSLIAMSARQVALAIRSKVARAEGVQVEQRQLAAASGSDASSMEPCTAEPVKEGVQSTAPLDLAGGEEKGPASTEGPAPSGLSGASEQIITFLSTLVDQDVTSIPAGSFVTYYRVSTAKQGASGLGLEAQRVAVKGYLNGGDWRVVGEFVEVESGRNSERPELAKALASARLHRAALVVANVSRLTRSSGFLHKLLDAGVDVRFADLPQIEGPTGRFMLQQMAAVAELEAGMIGDRTRKALAAAKARGTKLGGSRGVVLTAEQRAMGRAVQAARSTARAADVRPIIAELQAEGVTSLAQLAAALTERGIPTSRGADRWSPMQVSRVLKAVAHGT